MDQSELTPSAVGERARALYARALRSRVETPENIGKEIVIDIVSGDFEIDDKGMAASQRLRARRPQAVLYGMRIGYDAVYALGGSALRRTDP
jgi:hypothetical protein